MMAADQPTSVEPEFTRRGRRGQAVLRIVLAMCLVPLLVYLCLQADHARLAGTPMESWRLLPLIVTAATSALLGKRFVNSIAGLLLGGIGGAFGTLDTLAGPYGSVVGLVIGAIVVALPVLDKPPSNATPLGPASKQNEQTVRDGP
jgi:hypothetical protein